mgnify:CR=1 FL=1
MDLTGVIYTNSNFEELGELDVASADFAWGQDENTFEITLNKPRSASSAILPVEDSFIYFNDTRIGGIVRGLDVNADGDVKVLGDTWSGLFGAKTLMPPNGQAYYKITNQDATNAVKSLISHIGWGSMFECNSELTGRVISHTFDGNSADNQQDSNRFMNGWSALWQLMYSHGLSLSFAFNSQTKKIDIDVKLQKFYDDPETLYISKNSVAYKRKKFVNHLVCLGKGEKEQRVIRHIYADSSKNISTTQSQFGFFEISEVYDDSSADDANVLIEHGKKKLKELIDGAEEVDVVAQKLEYKLGDIIKGMNERTGITASATITKKIVKIEDCKTYYDYRTMKSK